MFIEVILPILSLAIALLTFIIAYIVYYDNSKGDVIVYLKVDLERQGLILLIIQNIGKGIAQDIKFYGAESINVNSSGVDIGALKVGTPILFPNEKLVYSLGVYHELKNNELAIPLKINITFFSKFAFYPFKRKLKNQTILDINSFKGLDIGQPIFQNEIRDSLKEISKSLKKMSS
ncbi:hypothetical protein [Acinetobacter guillouiae]|uniref:hypothetical protein n=1 Tax=Acinetobacter guillouiae TaxID=106649 RepID=UPI0032B5CE93